MLFYFLIFYLCSLLRIFQLSHIVLHSYQSVQHVCVCVYASFAYLCLHFVSVFIIRITARFSKLNSKINFSLMAILHTCPTDNVSLPHLLPRKRLAECASASGKQTHTHHFGQVGCSLDKAWGQKVGDHDSYWVGWKQHQLPNNQGEARTNSEISIQSWS